MEKKNIMKVTIIFFMILALLCASVNADSNLVTNSKENTKNNSSKDETVISSDNWEEWQDKDYWEWHTRTTTDDWAYNGEHIQIQNDVIDFYGYWQNSYKDFLYKDYKNSGKKTFEFIIDEKNASYHTLDGAGFIFNSKKEDGKLSGYILLFTQNTVNLYRLDDVDINEFETTSNKIVADYGELITSVTKTNSTIHKLKVITTPTNVNVQEDGKELMNVNLDYSKHVGNSFGLISSYTQHACSILSKIEFSQFKMKIEDYKKPTSSAKKAAKLTIPEETRKEEKKQEENAIEEKLEEPKEEKKEEPKQEKVETPKVTTTSQKKEPEVKADPTAKQEKIPYTGNENAIKVIILIAITGVSVFGIIKFKEYKKL